MEQGRKFCYLLLRITVCILLLKSLQLMRQNQIQAFFSQFQNIFTVSLLLFIMNRLLFVFALITISFCLQGVVQLTDANFAEQVYSEPKFWLVMFSASWCGHCTHLKPEIERLSPLLAELGVAVGHVDQKNNGLVEKFVVDQKTHMLQYPKLLVFLGQEQMGSVPSGFRNTAQILHWFKTTYNLGGVEEL